jgi:hypothetical protein
VENSTSEDLSSDVENSTFEDLSSDVENSTFEDHVIVDLCSDLNKRGHLQMWKKPHLKRPSSDVEKATFEETIFRCGKSHI